MALQTINNSESGLSVRTKINANFTELYGSLTANQISALVNTIPVFTGAWADLLSGYPAADHSGKRAVVIDPTYFTNTLRVRSDGTKWRLDCVQDLYFNITPMTGGAGTVTAEQLQHQWTAPAGFLTSLRKLSLQRLDYKTATSDSYTARIRIGAGATPLTDTLTQAATTMATTSRTAGAEALFTFPAATQARALGQGNFLSAWPGSSLTGAVYPGNYTIPDSDAAATVFSCTMQMTTGTDSSASGQAHLVVTAG